MIAVGVVIAGQVTVAGGQMDCIYLVLVSTKRRAVGKEGTINNSIWGSVGQTWRKGLLRVLYL